MPEAGTVAQFVMNRPNFQVDLGLGTVTLGRMRKRPPNPIDVLLETYLWLRAQAPNRAHRNSGNRREVVRQGWAATHVAMSGPPPTAACSRSLPVAG